MTFFTTISIDIKFRTVQYIPDRSGKTILEAIDNVFCVYNKGGFKIKEIRADPEFNKIDSNIMDELDIVFNPAPAQGHVLEIERSNRVLKERFRAMVHQLPYKS